MKLKRSLFQVRFSLVYVRILYSVPRIKIMGSIARQRHATLCGPLLMGSDRPQEEKGLPRKPAR
jgi:hypothetical protein